MSDGAAADLAVRAAELSDAPALASLMVELGYETSDAEMATRLNPILKDSRYRTFVAVSDGQVCGMIGTVCPLSYEHNDLSGRILALVVSGNMRKGGVGRQLISAAETDFVRRNVIRIALDTRFERTEAHQFYEKLGYKRNGFRFVKSLPVAAG